jgi:thiamine kinase-like enzyme
MSDPTDVRVRDLVERLRPELGEIDDSPEPLEGGITNRNFRLRAGDSEYVLRLPGKDTGLLEIDREAERAANAMAASAGVAPEVAAFLADEGILVTRFVTGEPVESEELREPVLLAEVAGRLHAVHSGSPLPSTFDSFRIVETYRETAASRGGNIPAAYDDALALARRLEPVMTGPEHEPVPCHNDLLAANFICSGGERIWIVDWEYAGMGDRYFDLANLSINNGFAEDDDHRLLEAYFREPATSRRFAWLRLMRAMSDFREAMWGVVQTTASELDFDFAGYAAEHFERLMGTAADPRFEGWLEDAHGDPA